MSWCKFCCTFAKFKEVLSGNRVDHQFTYPKLLKLLFVGVICDLSWKNCRSESCKGNKSLHAGYSHRVLLKLELNDDKRKMWSVKKLKTQHFRWIVQQHSPLLDSCESLKHFLSSSDRDWKFADGKLSSDILKRLIRQMPSEQNRWIPFNQPFPASKMFSFVRVCLHFHRPWNQIKTQPSCLEAMMTVSGTKAARQWKYPRAYHITAIRSKTFSHSSCANGFSSFVSN